mgnify:CR=1 FL=1
MERSALSVALLRQHLVSLLQAMPAALARKLRRDTPSRLPAMARQWGVSGDAHVLSGTPEQVLEKILKDLVNMAANNQYADFAGAEQAYMSISSVANGLARKGNSRIAQTVNSKMDRLLKLLSNDEGYDREAFQSELLALKAAVGA